MMLKLTKADIVSWVRRLATSNIRNSANTERILIFQVQPLDGETALRNCVAQGSPFFFSFYTHL